MPPTRWPCWPCSGDGAAERLGLTPAAGAARVEGGALLAVDPRLA